MTYDHTTNSIADCLGNGNSQNEIRDFFIEKHLEENYSTSKDRDGFVDYSESAKRTSKQFIDEKIEDALEQLKENYLQQLRDDYSFPVKGEFVTKTEQEVADQICISYQEEVFRVVAGEIIQRIARRQNAGGGNA